MTASEDACRPLLYVVRCNFRGTPEAEARWNAWYSGPKMADMLQMPMFTSGRRYRAVGLDQDVRYLAVWQLHSPAALDTPRYRARWGFGEWQDDVGDWSRDLLLPTATVPWDEVPPDEPIVVTAFDDQAVDHAHLPMALWCTSIGLDRTWPWVAIEVGGRDAGTEPPSAGVAWRTVYEPIAADVSGGADPVQKTGRR